MHSHYRHRQFPKRMSRSSTSGGVEFPFSQPWWPRYCDNSGARLMIYLEAIRHFPWQGTCAMRPGRGRHNDYEWHVIATKLLNEPKFHCLPCYASYHYLLPGEDCPEVVHCLLCLGDMGWHLICWGQITSLQDFIFLTHLLWFITSVCHIFIAIAWSCNH